MIKVLNEKEIIMNTLKYISIYTKIGGNMIFAITTQKGGLNDTVTSVFGRAATITIIDIDESTRSIRNTKVVSNPGANLGGGAGIETAQFIVAQGVNAVISGDYGVNSGGILAQAGIKMFVGSGTVKQAVLDALDGKLQLYQSTVQTPVRRGAGLGRGYGRGAGRGAGRGFGRGRGMGAGREF